MSSELFENQEEEFNALCDTVRKKVDDQIPKYVGGGCGCFHVFACLSD